MIVAQSGNRTFGISFAHPWLATERRGSPDRITTCALFELKADETSELPTNNWTELGSSKTACSKQDNFQRATGRKKSLQRVLCQHDYTFVKDGSYVYAGQKKCNKCGSPRVTTVMLNVTERKAIWNAYFDSLKPQSLHLNKEAFKEGEILSLDIETTGNQDPLEYVPGL